MAGQEEHSCKHNFLSKGKCSLSREVCVVAFKCTGEALSRADGGAGKGRCERAESVGGMAACKTAVVTEWRLINE